MAAQPDGSIPQQPLPLHMDLDILLQTPPRTALYRDHPFQQPTIGSFDRITPQTTRLFSENPSRKSDFDGEQTQMSQTSDVASAEVQNFFIHSTSVLKATFLKTSTPSDAEISRLAAQTRLDEYRVSTWFDIIRSLSGDRGLNTLPTPEVTQAYMPPSLNIGNVSDLPPAFSIDLGLSGTVENFPTRSSQTETVRRRKRSFPSNSRPSKRQRKEKSSQNKNPSLALNNHRGLSPRHSGKVSEQGQYCCPTCNFKTKKMDQWYTHQSRKHFPSEVFVCRIDSGEKRCNKGPEHPCKRKDNFATHLKDSHGFESGEALDKEMSKSTISVTGLFHDKCGFCSMALNTREDSMEHIGGHIEDGDDIDDWRHQCTSLDHKLEYPVQFKIPSDDPGIDDDNSDDDDTDPGNFGGWTQGGDYHPGEDGDSLGRDPDQGPGEGNLGGGAGGAPPPMRFMTAAKSVVSHRMETLKRGTPPEGFEQDSSHVRPLESFAVRRTLGHGGSGSVFEVSQVGLKQNFALKTIRRERPDSPGADHDAFSNEVRIMKSLRHPHIVQLLDSYVQPERFSLLFAPVADMDLARYLEISKESSLKDTSPLERSKVLLHGMGSIAAALKSLHSLPVCHGDIKPANILIQDNKFLVADFGASKIMPRNGASTTKNVQVTPEYAAPETIESRSLSWASDIFSLGCVFLEMYTVLLDRKLSDFADFRATVLGDKSYHKTLERTHEWIDMLDEEQKCRNCSDLAHSVPFDMLHKMLSRNPKDRPTVHEVWLRFPKCTCCSNWQASNHPPTSSRDDAKDQAPRATSKACSPINYSVISDKNIPLGTLRPRLHPSAAPLDEPQGRAYTPDIGSVPPRSQREDPLVDVVAVHGLNGYASQSWTWTEDPKASPSWLSNMIPDDLPRARVFTYSYAPIALAGSDPDGADAWEHAKHLLDRLPDVREDCPERPILFVAHGLGGTIVKETLRIAKHDQAYSGVYRATRGIVFLGASKSTPFQRLNEEALSQWTSNDLSTTLPADLISVGCFEASLVPEPSAGLLRTDACGKQVSLARRAPLDVAASTLQDQSSASSSTTTASAAPSSAKPIKRPSRKPNAEATTLWAAILKRSYDAIVENSEPELGMAKPDAYKFEISCC